MKDDKKIHNDLEKKDTPIVKDQPKTITDKQTDYKNKYLRALADYQNLENRVAEEKERFKLIAHKELLLKLLPILDNLEKAQVFVKDNGLKIINDAFKNLIKDEGLEEIPVMGREFDPYTSEVVDMLEGEKDNIVVDVIRKGYTFKGKVIRVAQVKVSKKKNNTSIKN